jgi:hypothetical protein
MNHTVHTSQVTHVRQYRQQPGKFFIIGHLLVLQQLRPHIRQSRQHMLYSKGYLLATVHDTFVQATYVLQYKAHLFYHTDLKVQQYRLLKNRSTDHLYTHVLVSGNKPYNTGLIHAAGRPLQ